MSDLTPISAFASLRFMVASWIVLLAYAVAPKEHVFLLALLDAADYAGARIKGSLCNESSPANPARAVQPK